MAKAQLSKKAETRPAICVRVGLRIRDLRQKKGWTQQMLADHAQIERAHLVRLEDGRKEAGIIILERLAHALDVQTYELLK